jgi:hypothetical protein
LASSPIWKLKARENVNGTHSHPPLRRRSGARGDPDAPPSLGTRRPRSIGRRDESSCSCLQICNPMHSTTKARRDEQSLSFLCSLLTLTGEESLLFVTPAHPPGSADLDSFDSKS